MAAARRRISFSISRRRVFAAQLDQLGGLGAALPVDHPVVDLGLAYRLDRGVEVSSDLDLAQVTLAGDPHHVTLQLGWEPLGHSDNLPAGPRPTEAVSTRPLAVPSIPAVGVQHRGGRGRSANAWRRAVRARNALSLKSIEYPTIRSEYMSSISQR
jgi:hypothetical protein